MIFCRKISVGARCSAGGSVVASKGRLLKGTDAVLGPLRGRIASVLVDDSPVDEPGTVDDYISENQSTNWLVDSLELSGLANGGGGSPEGGFASLGATSATFRVTGTTRRFDAIQNPFGIVITFR